MRAILGTAGQALRRWRDPALLGIWLLTGAWLLWRFADAALEPSALRLPAALSSEISSASAAPVRIAIPSIAVDAPVLPVGVQEDGAMGVPSSAEEVGWYAFGVVPGQPGQAVLTGHVIGSFWTEGVFADLEDVQTGDHILIEDAVGERQLFRVTALQVYDAQDSPAFLFTPAPASLLHLVTCAGTWDGSMFNERLVVTSEAIAS